MWADAKPRTSSHKGCNVCFHTDANRDVCAIPKALFESFFFLVQLQKKDKLQKKKEQRSLQSISRGTDVQLVLTKSFDWDESFHVS